MAKQQDQDREKLDAAEDSGDVSGQGRERRDDGEVYPQKRSLGDFGTHGGPNKHDSKSNTSPKSDE